MKIFKKQLKIAKMALFLAKNRFSKIAKIGQKFTRDLQGNWDFLFGTKRAKSRPGVRTKMAFLAVF
jgi:hypothetical protein